MYTTIQKLLILFIFLEEASYVSHVFDVYILLQFKISVFYLNIL